MNPRRALIVLSTLSAVGCASGRRERPWRGNETPKPPPPPPAPAPRTAPSADEAASTSDGSWRDPARQRDVAWRLRWPDGAAPCALVVHSHGLGGNRDGGHVWGRAWRDAGIAVLHVQHPGSDSEVLREGEGLRSLLALRSAADAEQLRARVLDIRFVVDELLRRLASGGTPWSRLRADALGVSGHSFGAHTVQAVAGQRFARPAPGMQDDRIRAFMAFSPSLGRGLSPQEQFAAVQRPFMCLTGSHDSSPLDDQLTGAERARLYDALPAGQRALLWIDGADHMTFGGGVGALPSRQSGRALPRHVDAERHEAAHQERIARITTQWWRAQLLGDAAAREALRTPEGLAVGDRWRMD